jgi:hypothetical protein
MTSIARTAAGTVLLAATTLLTWYAWLGRDTRYQLDANGHESGPWTTGQVAGCVLTLLVLLVVAVVLRVPWLIAAATLTIAFAGAWTVQPRAPTRPACSWSARSWSSPVRPPHPHWSRSVCT